MNKCDFCEYVYAHEVGRHNDTSCLYTDGCTSDMCRRTLETTAAFTQMATSGVRKEINVNKNYRRR